MPIGGQNCEPIDSGVVMQLGSGSVAPVFFRFWVYATMVGTMADDYLGFEVVAEARPRRPTEWNERPARALGSWSRWSRPSQLYFAASETPVLQPSTVAW